jgi:hypothetical protein
VLEDPRPREAEGEVMARVYRTDPVVRDAKRAVVDAEIPQPQCPWCGDDLDEEGRCVRNCEASRRRVDRRD